MDIKTRNTGYEKYSTDELIEEKEVLEADLADVNKEIKKLNTEYYSKNEKEKKTAIKYELLLIGIHSIFVFFFICAITGKTPKEYCYDVLTDGNNFFSAIVAVLVILAIIIIGGFFLFSLMDYIFTSDFQRKRNFREYVMRPYNRDMEPLAKRKHNIQNLIWDIKEEEQIREKQKEK